MGCVDFVKLLKKIELEKFELPDKRGFELTEKRRGGKKGFLPPGPPPFIN